MPTPTYRYQFVDLRTGAHIADLPLSGVTYDRRICQAGTFSGSMPIANAALASRAARVVPRTPADLTRGPGRTVVHVWRDGALWGSYIIWSATVSSDTRGRVTLTVQGAGIESWLHRMAITNDLDYQQVDQLDIARGLAAHAENKPGAVTRWRGIGLTTGGPASSGVLRDRYYEASDYASYGERLEQLSEVIGGPEWMIRTYPNSTGQIVKEFYTAPQIGDPTRVHVFAQPGNVLTWRYLVDATDATTHHLVRRASTEDTGLGWAHRPFSTPHMDAGWPILETVREYPTVRNSAVGAEYAAWWAAYRSGSAHTLEVTVRMPEHPTLTPPRIGEHARVILINPWFPPTDTGAPTVDEYRRVIGMQVRAPDDGAQETATLLFEGPRDLHESASQGMPQYPANIGEMLARISREQRAIISGSAPTTGTT
ncbi:hypothetical protein [Nocardiopsis tropica]|uniref:Rv3651-like N-terminal domain-containing protein n=1 Tax=Nocardiopsis tropica TaxID=109330 RepID=A0ABU7KM09_9ACTN|nr:hypothetical protein [Nocardiopsis umidischolae]MEE2050301.1 hypothetical protein [Nocardiopsis umidischolae]